jgi:hypothetical protein
MDDIIFDGSSHALVVKFADLMSREFEMSKMGELTFFLWLQIKQTQKERLGKGKSNQNSTKNSRE